ncbi:MAG: hypothetical protein ACI8W7_001203 [Gammaproteobacteria bacterium]
MSARGFCHANKRLAVACRYVRHAQRLPGSIDPFDGLALEFFVSADARVRIPVKPNTLTVAVFANAVN